MQVSKRIKLTIGFRPNVNQVVAQPLSPTQQLYKSYTGCFVPVHCSWLKHPLVTSVTYICALQKMTTFNLSDIWIVEKINFVHMLLGVKQYMLRMNTRACVRIRNMVFNPGALDYYYRFKRHQASHTHKKNSWWISAYNLRCMYIFSVLHNSFSVSLSATIFVWPFTKLSWV